ncbi:MAG TPA: PQQ-dependent sugar dehydrogenase [Gaiellaceae bacterium]|nr:PQQ-dependent sugar dehydrogenase [Gaiellaceae bacterium]
MSALVALVLVAFGAEAALTRESAPRPALRLIPVATFRAPVHATAPRNERGRLYVVERAGRIRVVAARRVLSPPFLDIRRLVGVGGERGLLSAAFHPDHAANGLLYVAYTARISGAVTVAEYRRVGARVDAASERVLVSVPHEHGPFHNGGQLAFGPDGLLYVGVGDGGYAGQSPDPDGNSQNRNVLLGKLFRLDPSAANPQPELVAYGLRNPWRFSFDRASGDLYLADVGWRTNEEVNHLAAGSTGLVDFGWSVYEGRRRRSTTVERDPAGRLVFPVHTYPTNIADNCSITGGFVYRGRAVERLRGRYVFGDYCSGRIWSLIVRGGRAPRARLEPVRARDLVSFAEDAAGELYAVTLTGRIYRFAD